MPESHKAEKRRIQKANRAAGIGDADGRLLSRVKGAPKMMCCTICQHELKCTKTNTELKMHSESKHGKTIDVCFPGAQEIAVELANGGKKEKGGKITGPSATKGGKKKKEADNMEDLLSAGLGAAKTKKKGKK